MCSLWKYKESEKHETDGILECRSDYGNVHFSTLMAKLECGLDMPKLMRVSLETEG